MKFKTSLLALALGLSFASCNQPAATSVADDFVDNVSSALQNGGNIGWDQLAWTREPASYVVNGDTLSVTTAPGTDLWQSSFTLA